MIEQIKFSTTWNNKLNCRAFSTIRRATVKYQVGNQYTVLLRDEQKGSVFAADGKKYIDFGVATIVNISVFNLKQLTNGMAYIDTGYSCDEVIKILNAMYGKGQPLPALTLFKFCILKYNGLQIPAVDAIDDTSFNYKQ